MCQIEQANQGKPACSIPVVLLWKADITVKYCMLAFFDWPVLSDTSMEEACELSADEREAISEHLFAAVLRCTPFRQCFISHSHSFEAMNILQPQQPPIDRWACCLCATEFDQRRHYITV